MKIMLFGPNSALGKQISKKIVSEHEHELTIYNQREVKIHFTNNIIGKLDEFDKISKNFSKCELVFVCLQEKLKDNYSKLARTLVDVSNKTEKRRIIWISDGSGLVDNKGNVVEISELNKFKNFWEPGYHGNKEAIRILKEGNVDLNIVRLPFEIESSGEEGEYVIEQGNKLVRNTDGRSFINYNTLTSALLKIINTDYPAGTEVSVSQK